MCSSDLCILSYNWVFLNPSKRYWNSPFLWIVSFLSCYFECHWRPHLIPISLFLSLSFFSHSLSHSLSLSLPADTRAAEPLEKRRPISAIKEESMGECLHNFIPWLLYWAPFLPPSLPLSLPPSLPYFPLTFSLYPLFPHLICSPSSAYRLLLFLTLLLCAGVSEKPDHLTIKAAINYIKHDTDPW